MRAADLLVPSLVCVPAPWRTFEATVTGLLGLVRTHHGLTAEAEQRAIQAVLAREAEASTALLEIGVGVPHARLADVARPALAIAIAPAGLYEPVPLLRIGITALVLSPLTAVQLHLQTLAGLSLLFRSSDLRGALLRATDAEAAVAAITAYDRKQP